jgi:hypothetical protein
MPRSSTARRKPRRPLVGYREPGDQRAPTDDEDRADLRIVLGWVDERAGCERGRWGLYPQGPGRAALVRWNPRRDGEPRTGLRLDIQEYPIPREYRDDGWVDYVLRVFEEGRATSPTREP